VPPSALPARCLVPRRLPPIQSTPPQTVTPATRSPAGRRAPAMAMTAEYCLSPRPSCSRSARLPLAPRYCRLPAHRRCLGPFPGCSHRASWAAYRRPWPKSRWCPRAPCFRLWLSSRRSSGSPCAPTRPPCVRLPLRSWCAWLARSSCARAPSSKASLGPPPLRRVAPQPSACRHHLLHPRLGSHRAQPRPPRPSRLPRAHHHPQAAAQRRAGTRHPTVDLARAREVPRHRRLEPPREAAQRRRASGPCNLSWAYRQITRRSASWPRRSSRRQWWGL